MAFNITNIHLRNDIFQYCNAKLTTYVIETIHCQNRVIERHAVNKGDKQSNQLKALCHLNKFN